MTKKDPVLWVVVDRFRLVWVHLATTDEVYANDHVARMNKSHPHLAPSDAAELERLRKVEDEAASWVVAGFAHQCVPTPEVVKTWQQARAARIAFEAKIGGGK